MSVEAHKWVQALRSLGWSVTTIAGRGADVTVPGLGYDPLRGPAGDGPDPDPLDPSALNQALSGFDVIVAENILSLPLNQRASDRVAAALRGRRVIVKHHDLPWHRVDTREWEVPDDPSWVHVTTTAWAAAELAGRAGISATVMHNRFAVDEPPGDRAGTRAQRRLAGLVLLQPTRALPRKNVAGGLALAEAVGATYWLLGPAEDGFQAALDELLSRATVGVLRGDGDRPARDAYAASDAVVLPSTGEGFGNPAIESALARRPLAIGDYPAGRELRALGFRWFGLDDGAALRRAMSDPDDQLIEHNHRIAAAHFDLTELPAEIESLLAGAVW